MMSNSILRLKLASVVQRLLPGSRRAQLACADEAAKEAARESLLMLKHYTGLEYETALVRDAPVEPLIPKHPYRLLIESEQGGWPIKHRIRVPCLAGEAGMICWQTVEIEFSGDPRRDLVVCFKSVAAPVAGVRGKSDWQTRCALDWIENFVIVAQGSDDPKLAKLESIFKFGFEGFEWAPDELVLLAQTERGYAFVLRGGLASLEDLHNVRDVLLANIVRIYGNPQTLVPGDAAAR